MAKLLPTYRLLDHMACLFSPRVLPAQLAAPPLPSSPLPPLRFPPSAVPPWPPHQLTPMASGDDGPPRPSSPQVRTPTPPVAATAVHHGGGTEAAADNDTPGDPLVSGGLGATAGATEGATAVPYLS